MSAEYGCMIAFQRRGGCGLRIAGARLGRTGEYIPFWEEIVKLISLVPIILFAALPAFADSINAFTVTAVQPAGFLTLTPNGDPLIEQSFCLPGCRLQFDVSLPTPSTTTTYTISMGLVLGGQVFDLSSTTITCTPQENPETCSLGTSYWTNCCSRTPIPGLLTVAVNGTTETFNFQYRPLPTPEPATAFLLATGLTAIVSRRYSHKRRRPAQT